MKKMLFIIVPAFEFAFALIASASCCYDNDCCDGSPDNDCCPSIDISNKNDSKINASIRMDTNTGWNNANGNAGVGKIDTGNASAKAYIESRANFNETRTIAPWLAAIKINNTNMSQLTGNVTMNTNTGKNNANGNAGIYIKASRCMPKITVEKEGRGVITTGNANGSAAVVQFAGSNFTKITK